jgi:hypothetical protein
MSRNADIHGHDLAGQQIARRQKLGFEMNFLHSQNDQVLACNTDVFIGDTPAEQSQYLEVTTASQVQNWLCTWKPFIQSSIRLAKDLSVQGVRLMLTYFLTEDTTPRALNPCAHHTA